MWKVEEYWMWNTERGRYSKGELAFRRRERYQNWTAEMECGRSVNLENMYRIPKPFVGVLSRTLNQSCHSLSQNPPMAAHLFQNKRQNPPMGLYMIFPLVSLSLSLLTLPLVHSFLDILASIQGLKHARPSLSYPRVYV